MNWCIQDIGWRVLLKAVFLRKHNWARCAMGALFVVFLAFRSTASSFWSAENRFSYHWQSSDVFALALLFGVCGALLCLGWVLAAALGRRGRWVAEFCFVCLLAFLLKVNGMEMVARMGAVPSWLSVAVKGVLGAVLVLFFIRREIVFRASRTIAVIFSPIVILYFFILLGAKTYATEVASTPVAPTKSTQLTGILVVVLDEWSYQRTFTNGVVSEDLPNMRAAADRCYVFHNAYSPAPMTYDSIPSLLCGVEGVSHIANERHWLKTKTADQPVIEYDTMFSWAKRAGYTTCVVGNYLPYADTFGKYLDHCSARDLYKILGAGPFSVAGSLLLENLRIRAGGICPVLAKPFYRAKSHYFVNLAEQIQALWLANAADMNGKFVFIHHSVPHMPLIFDRDGFVGDPGRSMPVNVKTYMGNLRYADTLVGQFLKAVGTADDVMWILTADHSFRTDPDNAGDEPAGPAVRHVPLLVHLPGQAVRHDVWDSFHTADLKTLISKAATSGFNSDQFRAILATYKSTKE